MTRTEHEISFGPYTAVATTRGGALRELRHEGRDLVVGFAADGEIPDYRGVICAPWPNRLAGGRYSFEGKDYQAVVNEEQRGTALHGLVFGAVWELLERTASSVRLGTRIEPGDGYPGRLDVSVDYELRPDGLHSTVRARNVGVEAAPYGACPHPYLIAGPAPLDEWSVQIPATEFMEVSADRLLPEGMAGVEGHAFDFRTEKVLGSVQIDHAFTGLIPNADGLAAVRVHDPSGSGVELEWDGTWPWLQIHTADKPSGPTRLGLAVEPMTCPPDAFNSGTDVLRLAPGESHEASWTIRALSR
ncbi:aldose 1-epimerase [Arthrobacter sp. PvP102]|uniref:aldose 1-epimerase family protein n=1 Tax=unclassified Arthrobacter TaxID=235627 RepID=UPI001AEB0B7E|nr:MULTISPECIES: aldose 1-epimerase family protein [unclassified Arthrobacter]MBP1231736.1 aldose 1-epimerase [Arthrobacter sp. PvP103]MBP1236871.1 aldose 1-epimerase [Arthrobacter sp. PvP102]